VAAVGRSGPSGRQRRSRPVPTRGGPVVVARGVEASKRGGLAGWPEVRHGKRRRRQWREGRWWCGERRLCFEFFVSR
jgi:hypothetical protein